MQDTTNSATTPNKILDADFSFKRTNQITIKLRKLQLETKSVRVVVKKNMLYSDANIQVALLADV